MHKTTGTNKTAWVSSQEQIGQSRESEIEQNCKMVHVVTFKSQKVVTGNWEKREIDLCKKMFLILILTFVQESYIDLQLK